jgi:hypothetical protein
MDEWPDKGMAAKLTKRTPRRAITCQLVGLHEYMAEITD